MKMNEKLVGTIKRVNGTIIKEVWKELHENKKLVGTIKRVNGTIIKEVWRVHNENEKTVIKRTDGTIIKEVWHECYKYENEDDVELFNNFCPFCGAPDKKLTSRNYYYELIKRDVVNTYCNKCKKLFFIIEIKTPRIKKGKDKLFLFNYPNKQSLIKERNNVKKRKLRIIEYPILNEGAKLIK